LRDVWTGCALREAGHSTEDGEGGYAFPYLCCFAVELLFLGASAPGVAPRPSSESASHCAMSGSASHCARLDTRLRTARAITPSPVSVASQRSSSSSVPVHQASLRDLPSVARKRAQVRVHALGARRSPRHDRLR